MKSRTKIAGVLAAALALMVGVRVSGQLGSSAPPPDPDVALARNLARDLAEHKDATGLVAVEQRDRGAVPSLYNSAHILRAMRLTGMSVTAPDDAALSAAVHAEARTVDPLWAWGWACAAADDGRIRPTSQDAAAMAKRVEAVLSASPTGDDVSATSDLIDAAVVARCLDLTDLDATTERRLASARTFTPEQAVRLADLGLGVRATATAPIPSSTAPTRAGDGCRDWDPVQGPALWLLDRLRGDRATPPPCLTGNTKGVTEPQALYWLARAGAFDPTVRSTATRALAAWKSKLLASGLVAETPTAQGSLQSSVLATELFASLGAIAETPPWLRDAFVTRSRTVVTQAGSGTGSGTGAAAASPDTQRREDETILVALGCHAIALSCPQATSAASEILRRPLPTEVSTAGRARQWIMVTDARRRLGIGTPEQAKVEPSQESWSQRGPVRTRLAAALCELGQCATAASLGTGEPLAQARLALDAGQLELATALLRLKGARQERVSLADLAPVTSRLGRYLAPGTAAMFSWTPGGPASVAATQAVYDSALALGFRASDVVNAATSATVPRTLPLTTGAGS